MFFPAFSLCWTSSAHDNAICVYLYFLYNKTRGSDDDVFIVLLRKHIRKTQQSSMLQSLKK